ncbi:hypothetical protein [uncultured Albimonas sp.]|uniref:hypothetical protein n=1 Tax=uncultured Albimonas sp. TaxID=1331701 RepID=UPI0030ECDC71|tara:strand:+ start:8791 stop:9996 length:1206 start_codon:yes stop_codon:yes gene_type:complete
MGRWFLHALSLAWAELRADPRSTACFMLAFVGAALPLLLLLALKQGAIGAIVDELVEDPRNREIIPVSSAVYDGDFAARAMALDGMGFFIPDTRNISARLALARNPTARRSYPGLGLLPTGPGDPLYDGPAPRWEAREVVLSAAAARELALSPGERMEARAERILRGERQAVTLELTVIAIAPAERIGQPYAFVPLRLLEAMEAFTDDASIRPETWLEQPPAGFHASFRAYAASVHRLEDVRDGLKALGADVRVRAENAAIVLRLDRVLTGLYALIATCGAGGFFLGLAASLRANLERQRAAFGMLRLLGAPALLRGGVCVAQALAVVGGGLVLTLASFFMLSGFVNVVFSDLGGPYGLIYAGAGTLVSACLAALFLAVVAALWSVREAIRIGADEGFRSG